MCRNKKFELLKLYLISFMLTCNMVRFLSLILLGLCPCVDYVVIGLSVRLSGYPM